MTGPKETAYDERIAPLMTQIIALCQEHKINMYASYMLDPREDGEAIIRCTTALPIDEADEEGIAAVRRLTDVSGPMRAMSAFSFRLRAGST